MFRPLSEESCPENEGAVCRPLSLQLLAVWVLARRAPMLLLEFEAALLQFTFHSPAFAALLQFPPTMGPLK